jgi:hypothetical protein
MAASEAIESFGTLFQRGDGVTPTEGFTTVAEVKDIEGPAMSRETHEVTHQESPDRHMERIGGLLDTGEVTFTLNWVPSNATHDDATGLIFDLRTPERRNYRLVFPDAASTTWTFPGLVTEFAPKAPVDGVLEADVTVTVCGAPTFS